MTTEIEILQYLHYNPLSKRADIARAVTSGISDRTLKRMEVGISQTHAFEGIQELF